MANKYNLKNPAVKRIMQEARELATESCYEYEAHPLEDNLFEWHFTVRGPGDTEFEEGRYHGRILLPAEYPFKPPELIFLTPNGRFELNTKVCLSITGYHPEYWQPAWGIRTVILAVMGFFPTEARGAIGGLDYTKEERRVFAKRSNTWMCSVCQLRNGELLSDNAPRKKISSSDQQDIPNFSLSYRKDNNDKSKDETEQNPVEQKQQIADSTKEIQPTLSTSLSQSYSSCSSTADSSSAPQHQKVQQEKKKQPSTTSPSTLPAKQPTVTDVSSSGTTNTNNNNNNNNGASSPRIQTRRNRPPLWLDGLIGALVMLVIALLIRRYAW